MKSKKITFIFLLLFTQSILFSQQIINLTTGTGTAAVGTSDPIWTTTTLPYGSTGTPRITSGQGCGSPTSTTTYNLYSPWEPCGRWISPHTITTPGVTFGAVPATLGQIGNYAYKMTFTTSNTNPVANATIVLNKLAADNSIASINVNGNVNSVSGVVHYSFSSISLNVTNQIVQGTNTIEVILNNLGANTALFMCGDLTINYCSPMLPTFTSPSSFCSGSPITVNGSASTGCIGDHVWLIAECDQYGNISPGATDWWGPFTLGAPGVYSFPSYSAGGPNIQCGKYYRVKLALQNSSVIWVESTKVIFINCTPIANAGPDKSVCPGSNTTIGTNVGWVKFTTFNWTETGSNTIFGTGQQISVLPPNTSSYILTVTNTQTGCTSSDAVTVTVVPAVFDLDISTGRNNGTAGLIPFGSADDTWKVRGVPGAIYSSQHSALSNAKVVSPHVDNFAGFSWATAGNSRWLSTTSDATGAPIVVPVSIYNQTNGDYHFETEFNLPFAYPYLGIEATEAAADNLMGIYLNSNLLSGGFSNLEYSLGSSGNNITNFNTIHNPGIFATNQAHYQQGTNTIIAKVMNVSNWMGFVLNAHVKGSCTRQPSLIISDEIIRQETIEATTFVYPNPSSGNFTVISEEQSIQEIIVRDALGKIVKVLKNANSGNAEISMENATKGLYIAEIRYNTSINSSFKKIIIE